MSSFKAMCDSITQVFSAFREPIETIPAAIIALSAIQRPGLSATEIASKIIERQTQAGAPYGPASDGSQSIAEAMERIRVEEIINALKLDSRIQISIPIGGIQIVGTGANEGGPVVINGYNVNFVHGDGIIG